MADVKAPRITDEMIAKVQQGSMQLSEDDAIALAGELYGRGLYGQVVNVCRQVIAARPARADAHNILGVALAAQGQRKEGVASLRRAIKLAPGQSVFHGNLGEVLRGGGQGADALLALIEAVRLDPRNAAAQNNLGIVRFERGEFAQAADAYRAALAVNPAFAEAWNNLGNALRMEGDADAARDAYQNALIHREVYPEVYNNLGTLLLELGRADAAEHALRKAIQQNPGYVDAHNNLAALYAGDGRDLEALRALGDVLRLSAEDRRALVLTARVQLRRGQFDPAEQACRIVLARAPGDVEAMVVLGQVLYETERTDAALAVLAQAVAARPEDAEARNYYGVTLKAVGRLDEARAELLKGVELCPTMYGAYANLSDLVDFATDRALFDRVETIVEVVGAGDAADPALREQLIPLHYAYAKALDDVGEKPRALTQYIAGGRLKRATLAYDAGEGAQFIADVKRVFDAEFFARRPFAGVSSEAPVFIVGMPRSGSTLVEQIIASHPQVFGGGEVKYLSHGLNVARDRFPYLSAYPEMARELNAAQFDQIARRYLADMMALAGPGFARWTDKLPTNYYFLGMIHLLFPKARIINTLRNPVDTCLSTFTKLFKDDVPHSYDLAELGAYYCRYVDLMAHWRAVLPAGVMTTVAYEDVVGDAEGEVRRLLAFLGLPWDEACLNFHASARPVKTASVAQVRKPLYRSSLERWRRYGPGLQPLIDALAPTRGLVGGLPEEK